MWDLKFPDQGLNPCPPAVEVRSLNPWIARKDSCLLKANNEKKNKYIKANNE